MGQSVEPKEDANTVLRRGLVATVIWFLLLILYLRWREDTWDQFKDIDKFGSFLQGAFAPLAFFWLVVTVLLQSRELKLQREELTLTRLELKNSVEQLQHHTTLMRDEQKSRSQEILENNFEHQLVKWALDCATFARLTEGGSYEVRWVPEQQFSTQSNLVQNAASVEHFASIEQFETCFKEVSNVVENLSKLSTTGEIRNAQSQISLSYFIDAIRTLVGSGEDIVADAKDFTTSKAAAILTKIRFAEALNSLSKSADRFEASPTLKEVWKGP